MTVCCNAGPLIALARVARLDLLPKLFGEVVVSPAVRREVVGTDAAMAGSEELRAASWLRVVGVGDPIAVDLLNERLDVGESEAIVLSLEQRAALLLIDEDRGRRDAGSPRRWVSGYPVPWVYC